MIKLIKYTQPFESRCISCLSSLECYAVVTQPQYCPSSATFTLCKDCLKELQKQMKEQLDD